ncbi:MAG: hypothetical protein AB6733_17165 [Clostridiaceae bacterium]
MDNKFKLLDDFNKKINFTKEKQQLIKEIYEPLIEEKTSKLKDLKEEITLLKNSITNAEKDVVEINKEILMYKDKLRVLENIFLKRL